MIAFVFICVGTSVAFNVQAQAIRPATSKTTLGIQGSRFTINGKPVFLYGISYYAALGAPENFIRKDLADIKKNGFNWIRVWANWTGFDADISAVDDQGRARKAFLDKLAGIVKKCDRQGIIVDVTLSHGDVIKDFTAHQHAVETIVTALEKYGNWYLDLANERNVKDSRYVSFEDLARLRETAKRLCPTLLVTASHGSDISHDDLREYLLTAQVDFICPHRPRDTVSASMTAAKTRAYLSMMKEMGRVVPVHYQEPFRRGYTQWQPKADDYLTDITGARTGGAAGWCFHNGSQNGSAGGFPRRSFDMHKKRLFDQLDPEELSTIEKIDDLNPLLHLL